MIFKKTKVGIVGILNNPATSLNSHSAGWNLILANQLSQKLNVDVSFLTEKDDWTDVTDLCVTHGPNYKPGSYNIIGGLNDEVVLRSTKLYNWALANDNRYNSLDQDFDFLEFVTKRKLDEFPLASQLTSHLVDLNKPLSDDQVWDSFTLGDSHSISVWQPGSKIFRRDGKTLYGFLKENYKLSPCQKATVYFGNIDIRFHLARQARPIEAVGELAMRYLDWASQQKQVKQLTLTHLLPVENEARKLPGTGLYKGEKFFGSRELRSDMVEIFNYMLDSNWKSSDYTSVNRWPESYQNELGELSFDVMEPKQSVHLRPKYYQWNASKVRDQHVLKQA